jgi:3-methylfumaryl-CoA hydratase
MDESTANRLHEWIGRSQRSEDDIAAAPLRGLWATLDREGPSPVLGDDVPPLGHWLYFNAAARQSELGSDGHPPRGGFLPPVPLPRRMWAGGSLEFHRALRVGEEAVRDSRIVDLSVKQGRSGSLVFVTVRHDITDAQGLAVAETQDLVYRDAPSPGAAKPVPQAAPTDERFGRQVVPNPALLFRYSALTFNGHRIHYDRPYATEAEGYPGLVVHGPLIATLLLDLLRRHRPDAAVRRFSFRAVSPLFDSEPFTVCGRPEGAGEFTLWARNHDGHLAMQATARLA